MPLRFRRTIKVAPGVKLNLSKGGVSTTVGSKGFHFNIGKHGVRRTVSIPGTGISETDYIEKKETASEKKREAASERRREDLKEHSESHANGRHVRRQEAASKGSSGLKTAFVIIGAVVFFIVGAVVLGLMPADFITNSLQFLTHAVQSTVH
ncbi:MAG: DUF4236 domain-containing protein [Anaerolineales bacterium]